MIVEAIRLLVTLTATAAGFLVGNANDSEAAILGAVVGAGVGYVFGGAFGRLVGKALRVAPRALAPRMTGPQLFAGAFGVIIGLIIGGVLAVPLWVFLPPAVGWSLGALVMLLTASFAGTLFAGRAEELLGAVGLKTSKPIVAHRLDATHRNFLIDSSAAIDGRILELARSGLLGGKLWVPVFVVDELQAIADSRDPTRRRRGRRGLDVLDALRDVVGAELALVEETVPEAEEVDAKLQVLATRLEASLVTTDHNLAKAAAIRAIHTVNPHSLGELLRPAHAVGDHIAVRVERVGSEPGQGIGYLDDGTMVVVEGAAEMVGMNVDVEVSNTLRTQVGRMLFARLAA